MKTGQPLGKAEIQLWASETNSQAGYGATSDASGHYLVEAIRPGKYTLSVTRNGYVRTFYGGSGQHRSATLLTLQPGQHMTKIDLVLTPQAVVAGRVVDEDNEPVAHVSLQLMSRAYQNGKRQLQPSERASTDDRGEYRIFGVAPGKYVLLASTGSRTVQLDLTEARSAKKEQTSYPSIYYPNSLSPADASQIQVAAGTELDGLDFRLFKVKSFTIFGKLVNEQRPNIFIQLLPKDNNGVASWEGVKSSMADSEGKFAFRGVQPGRYDIFANHFTADDRRSAHAEVAISDSNVDITLEFAQNPDLSGILRTDDPSDPLKPGIDVNAQPEGSMMGFASAETKDDGTFTLKSVPQQRIRLNLFPMPEGHYIKSIQLGETQLEDTTIDLTNGISGDLAIILSAKGATISGNIQDSQQKPVTAATVVLVPDNRKLQSRYKTASPDQNGQFTFKAVAPGSYKLYAFDNVEYDAWLDPDWLKQYENKGESVEVKDSDKATQNLVIIATGDS